MIKVTLEFANLAEMTAFFGAKPGTAVTSGPLPSTQPAPAPVTHAAPSQTAAAPATAPAPTPAAAAPAAATGPDFAAVKEAMAAAVRGPLKAEGIKRVLAEFNLAKVTDARPDQYAALIAALQRPA